MRLKKEVDDLKEDRQEKSRNQKLPEWIRKLPDDAANVEAKAGGIASDGTRMQDATGEGWFDHRSKNEWMKVQRMRNDPKRVIP